MSEVDGQSSGSNMQYTYSPIPASSYYAPISAVCVARAIEAFPRHKAIWNLLWLSVPSVDRLVGAEGSDWVPFNMKVTAAASAIISDVQADDELAHMLGRHPDDFMAWFESEDATIFDSFDHFGPTWATTVMARAELAARNLVAKNPIISFKDNVVHVAFPRLAMG